MKDITFNPDSPKGREILAQQEARLRRLDEESAPRHEEAVALWGIDAAARRAAENGAKLRVHNPWTGEGQSYEEYNAYLAKEAGNAAAGNVVEVDFTPNSAPEILDRANPQDAA